MRTSRQGPVKALLTLLVAVAATAQQPQLQRRVARHLAPLVATDTFRGVVLAARGDEVLATACVGLPAQAIDDASLCVMSLTKPVTTTVAILLADRQGVPLEASITEFLPDVPETWTGVRLLDLLQHRSFIPDLHTPWLVAAEATGLRGLAAWQQFAARVQGVALMGRPRTVRRYSNFNFDLLGAAIERISDQPYERLAQELVFDAVGMTSSGFASSTDDAIAPGHMRARDGELQPIHHRLAAGAPSVGLLTTAPDLHRFALALMRGQLLPPAMLERLWQPGSDGQAMAWMIERRGDAIRAYHGGLHQGFSSFMLCEPADEVCVIAISNLAYAPTERVARDIDRMLHGQPVRRTVQLTTEECRALTGTYGHSERHAFILHEVSGSLLLFETHGSIDACHGAQLVVYEDDHLGMPNGNGTLRIVREAGEPTAIEILDTNGQTAERLDRNRTATVDLAEIVGTWTTGKVQIDQSDRLWLKSPGVALRLTPIDQDRMLAMLTDQMATVMAIRRSGSGQAQELHWRHFDGQELTARRSGPGVGR